MAIRSQKAQIYRPVLLHLPVPDIMQMLATSRDTKRVLRLLEPLLLARCGQPATSFEQLHWLEECLWRAEHVDGEGLVLVHVGFKTAIVLSEQWSGFLRFIERCNSPQVPTNSKGIGPWGYSDVDEPVGWNCLSVLSTCAAGPSSFSLGEIENHSEKNASADWVLQREGHRVIVTCRTSGPWYQKDWRMLELNKEGFVTIPDGFHPASDGHTTIVNCGVSLGRFFSKPCMRGQDVLTGCVMS